jgi:hypothetical protein
MKTIAAVILSLVYFSDVYGIKKTDCETCCETYFKHILKILGDASKIDRWKKTNPHECLKLALRWASWAEKSENERYTKCSEILKEFFAHEQQSCPSFVKQD